MDRNFEKKIKAVKSLTQTYVSNNKSTETVARWAKRKTKIKPGVRKGEKEKRVPADSNVRKQWKQKPRTILVVLEH